MVADVNIKEPENSMETHKIYLDMFNMGSINYSANVNATLEFSPCTLKL
jgi:hypothetical protein